jgi:hypothetical protein
MRLPKFVVTQVMKLVYHPYDNNAQPLWASYAVKQVELRVDGGVYFRGPGGGFYCKHLFVDGIYAYFVKDKAIAGSQYYYKFFAKDYRRLKGEA